MTSSERKPENTNQTKVNSMIKTSSNTPTASEADLKFRTNPKENHKDGISNYFVESGTKLLGSTNVTPSRRSKI